MCLSQVGVSTYGRYARNSLSTDHKRTDRIPPEFRLRPIEVAWQTDRRYAASFGYAAHLLSRCATVRSPVVRHVDDNPAAAPRAGEDENPHRQTGADAQSDRGVALGRTAKGDLPEG
jgi:hypothetical protein